MALETARLRAEQQEVIRELSRANDELRRGRAVLEWAEQQHHQLMQLVLDEVGLPELVSALASALRASVTVEDTDGRVLASAPAEGYCPPPASAARQARAAEKAQEESGRRYTVARVPVPAVNGRISTAGGPPAATAAWAAPVVVGGELAGRLWVTAPRSSSPSCCSSNGTWSTCRADSPATYSATCSETAVRSGPRPCSTGRQRSGMTCPGHTSSRC